MTEEDRVYLGESVHAYTYDNCIVLTVNNGGTQDGNAIYLDPKVALAFMKYIKKHLSVKKQDNKIDDGGEVTDET